MWLYCAFAFQVEAQQPGSTAKLMTPAFRWGDNGQVLGERLHLDGASVVHFIEVTCWLSCSLTLLRLLRWRPVSKSLSLCNNQVVHGCSVSKSERSGHAQWASHLAYVIIMWCSVSGSNNYVIIRGVLSFTQWAKSGKGWALKRKGKSNLPGLKSGVYVGTDSYFHVHRLQRH